MSAYFRVTFQAANNEDLRQAFALTDQAGAPVDIASATMRMAIGDLNGQGVIEASTSNGRIVVLDAAQGQFELAVPASVMATLREGVYRHDLLFSQAGETRRIWTGTLDVSQGVTS